MADMYGATVRVPAGQTLNLRRTPGGAVVYTPGSGSTLTVDSDRTNAEWIKITSYPETCYGMRKFIDTGTVSNPTVSNMFGSGDLQQSSTVKAAVFNLQWALTVLACDPGPIDGIFGSQTKAAVERFQRDFNSPPVDGIVGDLTKANIVASLKL